MAKRKTSSLPSKVYVYGCWAPTENAELFDEQHKLAHRYYNALIETELKRRQAYREARMKYASVDRLQARLDIAHIAHKRLSRQIALLEKSDKRRKALSRRIYATRLWAARRQLGQTETLISDMEHAIALGARLGMFADIEKLCEDLAEKLANARAVFQVRKAAKADTTAEREAVLQLRSELKQVRSEQKIIRKAVNTDPDLKREARQIQEDTKKRIKELRRTSGCFWGSYVLIEKQMEQVVQSKVDPRFRRFGLKGRVGVQLQLKRGKPDMRHTDQIMLGAASPNQFFQIEPLAPGTWQRQRKDRQCLTTARIRIGSDTRRKPVWAEFPVVLHRPLPPGEVTWAWVKIEKLGYRKRYRLQITVQSEELRIEKPNNRAVAVDLGWRQKADGQIRVGYAVDDAGQERELLLPAAIGSALELCSRLRSYNDDHFNVAKAVFSQWMRKGDPSVASIAEETTTIAQWRNRSRLQWLMFRWCREVVPEKQLEKIWTRWMEQRLRPAKKKDLFDTFEVIDAWVRKAKPSFSEAQRMAVYMEFWRQKEYHLYEWEANQRDKTRARRMDLYRNWAAELATSYGTLVLEKFDLGNFSRTPPPENEDPSKYLHYIKRVAAPSVLRNCLTQRFAETNTVSAVDSTRECSYCGHVTEDWDKPQLLIQQCGGCGRKWDQDSNAARVLLSRHFEEFGKDPGSRVA